MYVISQQYTIGRYNESPEGSLSTTGASLLASSLAWAANNNIPFHQAILSLNRISTTKLFFLVIAHHFGHG